MPASAATLDGESAEVVHAEADKADRWAAPLSVVALVVALAPIVTTVIRTVASGWVPIFDAGYFTVRSRDVLTANHPWVGAWSSVSRSLGENVRNLGPLQLDLLAPFTRLDPYWGTAVGVGVVASAAVVAVWWSARRVLGPNGAVAAMLATVALEAAIGSESFIDPRQQTFLLLPYWALLWLTWAVAVGQGAAIAPLVFTASLIMQTHLTYLIQTVALVIVGLALYVAGARGRWREVGATRALRIGAVVGLVCWAQPMWDQFAGSRNLSAVLTGGGGSDGVGWSLGARTVGGTVLVPPRFWLPEKLERFALPADLVSPSVAWIAFALWLAAVAGSAGVAWFVGNRKLAALGVIAGVALVTGFVAGARIPLGSFGFTPQNYFWMWPTGVFLTVSVVAGAVAAAGFVRRWVAWPAGAVGLVIAAAVIAVVAARPVSPFGVPASARTAGERVARPVVEQLASGLRRHRVTGPLLVDYSRGSFGAFLRYVFLAELQRAGIEFTFPAEHEDINRFGDRRCEHGQAVGRIVLADAGGDPAARDGEVILARLDAFTDVDQAELEELDRSFGDWFRDGTVAIDRIGLAYLAGREPPRLDPVLSTPGRPATGLAMTLNPWADYGVIDVPAELNDAFDRWADLENRSTHEEVTILLAPVETSGDDARTPIRGAIC